MRDLHEERVEQIRHRVEAGQMIPGDAEYLLAALDHAERGDPESYRFDLAHDAVGDDAYDDDRGQGDRPAPDAYLRSWDA